MESLASQAKRLAKAGDYDAALRAYDKAVSVARSAPEISLLDGRAQCYEKLQQFKAAASDARRMIELDHTDARGWLRLAKIQQLVRQDDKALQTYRRGIQRVTKYDRLRPLLEKLCTALERRLLQAAPRVDPVDKLPPELLDDVFAFLSAGERMRLLTVSRRWCATLSTMCRTLVLIRDTPGQAVKTRQRWPQSEMALMAIAKRFKSLHHLYLASPQEYKVSENGYKSCLISWMANGLPNHLTTLCLYDFLGLSSMLAQLPHLRSLTVRNVDDIMKILKAIQGRPLCALCLAVAGDTIGRVNRERDGTSSAIRQLTANPALKSFALRIDSERESAAVFEPLLFERCWYCPNVERLELSGWIPDIGAFEWPSNLKGLRMHQNHAQSTLIVPEQLQSLHYFALATTFDGNHVLTAPDGCQLRQLVANIPSTALQASFLKSASMLESITLTFRPVDTQGTDQANLHTLLQALSRLQHSVEISISALTHESSVLTLLNAMLDRARQGFLGKLRRLQLEHCALSSPSLLVALLVALPNLKVLALRDTVDIDPETRIWLRKRLDNFEYSPVIGAERRFLEQD